MVLFTIDIISVFGFFRISPVFSRREGSAGENYLETFSKIDIGI
jgi:hypothetical protein